MLTEAVYLMQKYNKNSNIVKYNYKNNSFVF